MGAYRDEIGIEGDDRYYKIQGLVGVLKYRTINLAWKREEVSQEEVKCDTEVWKSYDLSFQYIVNEYVRYLTKHELICCA